MVNEFTSYDNPPILSYNEVDFPKIFIGCIIKNRYDEERVDILESANPERIVFFDTFLYGSLFEPCGKYANLVESIKNYRQIDLYTYNKELLKNNLSCEDNFGYFGGGLYPIDPKHISDMIENFKYDSFFDDNLEMPMYQRIKSINMFVLIP